MNTRQMIKHAVVDNMSRSDQNVYRNSDGNSVTFNWHQYCSQHHHHH